MWSLAMCLQGGCLRQSRCFLFLFHCKANVKHEFTVTRLRRRIRLSWNVCAVFHCSLNKAWTITCYAGPFYQQLFAAEASQPLFFTPLREILQVQSSSDKYHATFGITRPSHHSYCEQGSIQVHAMTPVILDTVPPRQHGTPSHSRGIARNIRYVRINNLLSPTLSL